MKKALMAVLMLTFLAAVVQAQSSSRFYFESISNSSKTTDFLIGVYPSSYTFTAAGNDGNGVAKLKMAIINNSSYTYNWNNYRVLIQLKDGKLFSNYTTQAETGDHACTYEVSPGKTRYQYLCYDESFSTSDISRVFVLIKDKIFELMLSDK